MLNIPYALDKYIQSQGRDFRRFIIKSCSKCGGELINKMYESFFDHYTHCVDYPSYYINND